jgi:hypothetical protein
MRTLVVAAIVLLAAVGQGSTAAAQISAPAPTATNAQALPWWFIKHQYMPGMPWFHRSPAPPEARRCRIAYWYPAQFWNTDEWGHTVTWTGYAPQYVCD